MADDEKPVPEAKRDEPSPLETAPISEALGTVVRRILDRGRHEIERAAQQGRVRLELRALQRDRDQFWIRLGKTAYRLVESGELEHPAIRKAMKRLDDLERRIRDLEAGGSGEANRPTEDRES